MDRATIHDPAEILNARAAAEGWPTQFFSRLKFDRPELNGLAAVWREKAKNAPAPHRSDLDARVLKPVLRNITIAESVHEGGQRRFRIRLVGSEIAELFGNHANSYIDEMVPPELLPRWHVPYDTVLESCRPLRVISHFDHPAVNYLTGESLLAPLLDEKGKPTLLIAATYFQSRMRDQGGGI